MVEVGEKETIVQCSPLSVQFYLRPSRSCCSLLLQRMAHIFNNDTHTHTRIRLHRTGEHKTECYAIESNWIYCYYFFIYVSIPSFNSFIRHQRNDNDVCSTDTIEFIHFQFLANKKLVRIKVHNNVMHLIDLYLNDRKKVDNKKQNNKNNSIGEWVTKLWFARMHVCVLVLTFCVNGPTASSRLI